MNNKKTNSYSRLLVFFVLTAILILTVSLVANGWQKASSEIQNENSGNTETVVNGEADNNKNNETDQDISTEQTRPEVYYNPLTGKETTQLLSEKRHMAFIFNSISPLYGIGAADMLIEVPTENGATRFAALINNYESLGKLGSLDAAKGYLCDICSYFGSPAIFYGKEGKDTLIKEGVDLSTIKGYHYTEYTSLIYTNGNLITGAISSLNINNIQASSLPFSFISDESESLGYISAGAVSLPISDKTTTDLIYSVGDKKYNLIKNGAAKNDLLTNSTLSFDNCFILYTDTVTYDTKEGSEMIMDTKSGGIGYYLSQGLAREISYSINENGDLIFKNTDGSALKVNKGTSYLAFLKASKTESTIFS